jgi:hypothetical protein
LIRHAARREQLAIERTPYRDVRVIAVLPPKADIV